MTGLSENTESPCINVCVLNPRTQLCEGCFRTLDEIAAWSSYSTSEKRAVLAELDERCERILDGALPIN